jgi:hypothetical protein
VQVDQSRRGELGVVTRERFIEAALVVVVPVVGGVVLTAYINDDGAGFEECRVPSADEGTRSESGKLAEKIDSKSLVCVEVTAITSVLLVSHVDVIAHVREDMLVGTNCRRRRL